MTSFSSWKQMPLPKTGVKYSPHSTCVAPGLSACPVGNQPQFHSQSDTDNNSSRRGMKSETVNHQPMLVCCEKENAIKQWFSSFVGKMKTWPFCLRKCTSHFFLINCTEPKRGTQKKKKSMWKMWLLKSKDTASSVVQKSESNTDKQN